MIDIGPKFMQYHPHPLLDLKVKVRDRIFMLKF